MTSIRKLALDILISSEKPLSAAALYKRLENQCDQATVYRTLHYFEEQGYAESFVLHCDEHGTERYYTAARDARGLPLPHRHWFHCEGCHQFTQITTCGIAGVVKTFESQSGARVTNHILYLMGLCAACQKKREAGSFSPNRREAPGPKRAGPETTGPQRPGFLRENR